jgi:hypothetical protein
LNIPVTAYQHRDHTTDFDRKFEDEEVCVKLVSKNFTSPAAEEGSLH